MKKIFFILLLTTSVITAQERKVQVFNAEESQMLFEIKGIVIVEKDKIIIGPIPPADQRESEYRNLDLQANDEIVFVNGKKVKTISDFKKFYGELKTGEEIKLGIQRGKDRFIVQFKKGKETPGGQKIMKFSTDGKGGENIKVEGGKVLINGKMVDIDSLKKSGRTIIQQKK